MQAYINSDKVIYPTQCRSANCGNINCPITCDYYHLLADYNEAKTDAEITETEVNAEYLDEPFSDLIE